MKNGICQYPHVSPLAKGGIKGGCKKQAKLDLVCKAGGKMV
jgi:hypothetical protein